MVRGIAAKLYWFPISHPSHAARTMLELKGIDYDLAHVMPGNQRIHMRLAGFRGGTVPALRLDGRKIQGSTQIARELDAVSADPPLYPADPESRRRVEDAERWGDTQFQPVPRRILRWALTKDAGLRRWLAESDGALPLPAMAARVTAPVSMYYARLARADRGRVRKDIAALPSLLDRVDELIAEKVITRDPPNAATLQVMCTVRSLLGFSDFAEQVGARSFAPLARQLFPHFPDEQVPPFVERLELLSR
jgi:glutathione S-transferase